MSDNLLDPLDDDLEDDFDIYADLDDNDNTIGSALGDNHNLISGDMYLNGCELSTESQTQNAVNFVDNEKNGMKDTDAVIGGNNTSNDMILSELTIVEKSLNRSEDINKSLVKHNEELKRQLAAKDKQLSVLKTNISSLYKTAKAEIERKKREMTALREELDSIIFRRLKRCDTNCDTNTDQLNAIVDHKVMFCDKSTNTSDKDIHFLDNNRLNNNYKSTERSTKVVNKELNRRERSRSRSRRSVSRDRQPNSHRNSGQKDSKSYSSKRCEDHRRSSGSKSTTDCKPYTKIRQKSSHNR